jgi:hypothetical protein
LPEPPARASIIGDGKQTLRGVSQGSVTPTRDAPATPIGRLTCVVGRDSPWQCVTYVFAEDAEKPGMSSHLRLGVPPDKEWHADLRRRARRPIRATNGPIAAGGSRRRRVLAEGERAVLDTGLREPSSCGASGPGHPALAFTRAGCAGSGARWSAWGESDSPGRASARGAERDDGDVGEAVGSDRHPARVAAVYRPSHEAPLRRGFCVPA